MNHVEFIAPAYALTIAGLAGLVLVSWLRMRAAERVAQALRSQGGRQR